MFSRVVSVFRNLSVYVILDILGRFIKIMFLPLLIYFVDTSTYAEVSLFISYGQVSLGLVTFNIGNYFRHIRLRYPKESSQYIFVFYIILILSSIFFYLLLNHFGFQNAFFLSVYTFALGIHTAYNFSLLGDENKIKYGIEMMIVNFIYYGSVIIAVICFDNVEVLTALAFFSFVGSLYVISKTLRGLRILENLWSKGRYLFKQNIPLMIYGLGGMIMVHGDKWFINRFQGEEGVAQYTYIYSYFLLFGFLSTAVNNMYTPIVYMKLKHRDMEGFFRAKREVLQLSILMLMFAPIVSLVSSSLSPESIEYSHTIFSILSLSSLVLMGFSANINVLMHFEDRRGFVILGFLSLLINSLLNFVLIPLFGVTGAATSTTVSYIVMYLVSEVKVRKFLES